MGRVLRGMAKTAVVAGTAKATRNAVNRHSASKNAQAYSDAMYDVQQNQAVSAPPPAAPAPQEDQITQLERLGNLKAQGILTEEEFTAQKAKILGT